MKRRLTPSSSGIYNDLITQNGHGRLAVIGSAHLFSDQYLDKEENGKLQEVIWQWMTSDDITLNTIDADNPDVSPASLPSSHNVPYVRCQ